jgi:excisionase family DNA binding protein
VSTHTVEPAALRPSHAAPYIGVSRARLYELIQTGHIEARKLGSATVVLRTELDRYLASLPIWGGDDVPAA